MTKREEHGRATFRAAGLAITAFLLILAFPLSGAAQDEEDLRMVHTNPHNPADKRLCSICHTAEPPMLNRDPVTTCTRCHPGNVGNHPVARHPMGLATGKNIPAYLPLTEERQMVCHTCHDPHKKTGFRRMLRVEYFRLCISCHKGY